MNIYWHTSAPVRYFTTENLDKISCVTRTHSLTQNYLTFTSRGYDEHRKR
jgi:hypothetical protein